MENTPENIIDSGLSGNQLHVATGEPDRRALGFAGVAKQLAFERIETVASGEKPVTVRIAHDDSRRLRRDFDNVGV